MVNKNVWILAVYYAFVYMSVGSFSSYIGVYFTQAGISHTQIGFLTSIGAALGLLAQPLWGLAGDRSRTKNRVLLVCTFCTAFAGNGAVQPVPNCNRPAQ
jgi:PPP family 3-phenylpropionic acid transporter